MYLVELTSSPEKSHNNNIGDKEIPPPFRPEEGNKRGCDFHSYPRVSDDPELIPKDSTPEEKADQ